MSIERLKLVERCLLTLAKLVSRWWQQATTEHELRCLSDRDLADIGIARDGIRKLARERAGTIARAERGRTIGRHKSTPFVSAFRDPLANPLADRSSTKVWAVVPNYAKKCAMHEDAVEEMVCLLAGRQKEAHDQTGLGTGNRHS